MSASVAMVGICARTFAVGVAILVLASGMSLVPHVHSSPDANTQEHGVSPANHGAVPVSPSSAQVKALVRPTVTAQQESPEAATSVPPSASIVPSPAVPATILPANAAIPVAPGPESSNFTLAGATGNPASSPNQSASAIPPHPKPTVKSLTMEPLVCSMTVSASPLGDFVNQQVTFTASGCTPPSGFYWTWGNLPPGCITQNSGTLTCTPTGDGKFSSFASIISSGGSEYANAYTEITVYSDLAVTTPSTPVDTGMNYNLSVSPTDDSVGDLGYFYYYLWSNLPPGCQDNSGTGGGVSTGHPWSDCNTGTSGKYTPSLTVVYSNGVQISNSLTFTVYAPPSPSISLPSSRDTGQSITFSSSVSDGAPPLQYQWSDSRGNPLQNDFISCSSGGDGGWSSATSVTCTASSAGRFTIYVYVIDSAGVETGAHGPITIYSDPTISGISNSRWAVDLGQAVWFNATATGGSGQDAFSWTNLPASGCSGVSTASLKCVPSSTGSLTPSVTVQDSNGYSSPSVAATPVHVYSDPVIDSVGASRTTADENQLVWFNATVSGGYSGGNGYVYTWSSLPGGCSAPINVPGADSVKCSPTVTGTFYVTVLVSDQNGYAVRATASTGLTLSTDPTITDITIGPRETVDVNQVAWYNATASGGNGGYTFAWRYGYDNQPPPSAYCTGLSTSSVKCVETITGDIVPEVAVTDSNGFTSAWALSNSFSNAEIAVSSDPTVSVVASRTSVDEGQVLWFNATVNGGYGGPFTNSSGFNYTWSGLPSVGCSGWKNTTVGYDFYERCVVSASTSFTPTLKVIDWNNYPSPVTAAPTVQVLTDPQVGSPQPSTPTADVGSSVTFTVTPSGGTGNYYYSWSGLPMGKGCTSANLSIIDCTPSQQTIAYVAVSVKDTNGYSTTSSPTLFVVHSSPFVSLQVNRSKLDSKEAIQFYANASGGTSVYHYAYSGLPSGCSTANTSRLSCSPTAPGGFIVTVWVNDTGGGKATSSISFIVYPDPTVTSHWFPLGGQTAYANESLSLEVNFTGGIGPYSSCISGPPAWPTGCVSGLGGSNLTIPDYQPFTQAGTYPVSVNISDSTGWVSTLRFNESIYWPINVSVPTIPTVHQGSQANLTFILYQDHGAPPMEWWLNDSTRGTLLCGPVAVPSYGTQSCSFTPNWNGTDRLNLTVKDGLHSRLFVTCSYQVLSDLGHLALSTQAGSYSAVQGGTLQDEVGAVTAIQGSYSGGSSPYTCTLTENGSGTIALWSSSTTSCSTTYAWAHAGIYTLNLTVKDSLGGGGGSVRQWLIVDVTAPISVTSVTPAQASLDSQVTDNVSAKFSGGLPAFSFAWDFGNGVTKTTSQAWVLYAWPSPGTFTVKVTVTDGTGASSTLSTYVQVIADPAVRVLSVVDGPISTSGITSGGSTTLPSGTTASFNLTFVSGTGPYSVLWKLNGTTVNSTTVFGLWTNHSLTWSTVGNDSLTVSITDSEGQVSIFTLSVKVIVDLVGPVTLSITRSVVDSGMWANATASATGGWAPFTYDWLIASANSNRWVNGSVNALDATWTASGSYSITARVIDAFGYTASEVTKLTVNGVPTAPCAPQLASGIPMTGNALTFSLGCVSGGTGPLSYSWSLGGSHQVTTVPQVTVAFHQATTYTISVNVTDALGETAISKVLTLGTIPPSIDNATYQKLSLSHNTTANGTVYHLELEFVLQTSDTDGTVAGYRYSTNESNLSSLPWIPLSEKGANLTLGGPAIQQLYIQVVDNYNRTSSPYTLALNLTIPPSGKGPTGPSGQGTDWGFTFLLVVIAVVVALAAVLAFVELRKRRHSGGQSTTTTDGSSGGSVADAITDHLKENPNEEEAALVHHVVSKTGATEATVLTQLSVLSESRSIEKTESGGVTRYSISGGEIPREELARMGMITDTMLSTIRSETPTTGRRLKEVLTPYNLSEGEIRNYLLDLRTEISWDPEADFGDFDTVVFRAMPSAPQTPTVEVVVDESVLPRFLDDSSPASPGSRKRGKRSPVG